MFHPVFVCLVMLVVLHDSGLFKACVRYDSYRYKRGYNITVVHAWEIVLDCLVGVLLVCTRLYTCQATNTRWVPGRVTKYIFTRLEKTF